MQPSDTSWFDTLRLVEHVACNHGALNFPLRGAFARRCHRRTQRQQMAGADGKAALRSGTPQACNRGGRADIDHAAHLHLLKLCQR